ncbi:hypothetical protein I4641_19285 [Waterburya agarophytonicola K14]|uniref:Uncharacterized protein n=1 Tax=Waterburya agarophytonicola KI4 TaxID=2874699 RepID=A0A964BWP6_9CYAN|nr:hypothetical protein [Waterburya agarophytonicola]MCC0179116.1 hypothetical protein [Waterburya agarophytonicola KI4]
MSFSERDLKDKLDQMEAEIDGKTAFDPSQFSSKSVFPQVEINPSPQVQGWIDSSKAWFATLPQVGKAAVAIGGVWLGFSILGAVLHVVSSVVSIAFVGLLLYVAYRLFKK